MAHAGPRGNDYDMVSTLFKYYVITLNKVNFEYKWMFLLQVFRFRVWIWGGRPCPCWCSYASRQRSMCHKVCWWPQKCWRQTHVRLNYFGFKMSQSGIGQPKNFWVFIPYFDQGHLSICILCALWMPILPGEMFFFSICPPLWPPSLHQGQSPHRCLVPDTKSVRKWKKGFRPHNMLTLHEIRFVFLVLNVHLLIIPILSFLLF